jgi:hypothetical protein
LIFLKKSKLNQNQFKPTSFGRFGSVWFFRTNRFKPVWLGFFPVWVRFFRFKAYKTETKPVSFFKILIDFFLQFSFFSYFFSNFSNLINFLIFFSPLRKTIQLLLRSYLQLTSNNCSNRFQV